MHVIRAKSSAEPFLGYHDFSRTLRVYLGSRWHVQRCRWCLQVGWSGACTSNRINLPWMTLSKILDRNKEGNLRSGLKPSSRTLTMKVRWWWKCGGTWLRGYSWWPRERLLSLRFITTRLRLVMQTPSFFSNWHLGGSSLLVQIIPKFCIF